MATTPSTFSLGVSSVVTSLRGALLAAFVTHALFPYYLSWIVTPWPYGDRLLYIACSLVIHEVLYFGLNSLYYFGGSWLKAFAIPRTKRMVPSDELVRETVREAIMNHLLVQPLSLYFLFPLLAAYTAMPPMAADLPSFLLTAAHFFAADRTNDVLFYFAHRLLHHPAIYARVHKQHHKYVGSIGFAAEYAHPVEQLFANQLPTMVYCFAMGVHPLIWFVWLAWRLSETYEAHSGYDFYGTVLSMLGFVVRGDALHHDWHHSNNSGAYGSEFMDRLFQTDEQWARAGGKNGLHAATGQAPAPRSAKSDGGAAEAPDASESKAD